jgi:hypothetical protein
VSKDTQAAGWGGRWPRRSKLSLAEVFVEPRSQDRAVGDDRGEFQEVEYTSQSDPPVVDALENQSGVGAVGGADDSVDEAEAPENCRQADQATQGPQDVDDDLER